MSMSLSRHINGVMAIARRDLKGYFSGPSFYIIAFLFTLFLSYTYYATLRHFAQNSLRFMMQTQGQGGGLNLHSEVFVHHISNVNLVLLFFTPFLTMRLFAEEKKMRSFDLLLTSPVTATDIVIGKFLAGLGTATAIILISAIYPITTRIFTEIQWAPLASSYLGLFFLAAAYVSIGVFCSSLTDNMIVAGISSIILSLFLWFIAWSSVMVEDSTLQTILQHFSISQHFGQFVRGSIELKSIIFHVSVVFMYAFLTQRVVESARWR